ncbi:hypothetical protein ACSQ67_003107 [Phaseolus vulgaris]
MDPNPIVLNTSSRTASSALDKAVIVVFDQLPHKLPTREIISLYASSDPGRILLGCSVGLVDTVGVLAAVPSTTVLRRGPRLSAKKRGRPLKEIGTAERAIPNNLRANTFGGRYGYSRPPAGGADRRRE